MEKRDGIPKKLVRRLLKQTIKEPISEEVVKLA